MMTTIYEKLLFVMIFLFVVTVLISGCSVITPSGKDAATTTKLVADARESIGIARSEGATEHSPQEFAQAESLFKKAEEALKRKKTPEAEDLAFLAGVEAKIATAMAQEAKARRRAAEVNESIQKIMWETKVDEAAAAKARQAIAERTMLEEQKKSEMTDTQANKEIQKAKVELAIAKARFMMDLAEQTKASEYAQQTYTNAKAALQKASSALTAGNLQEATATAEEAVRYSSNAYIEAKAKLEAEAAESLRARDKAITTIAKAELSMEHAKGSLAIQYTGDMFEKAEKILKEAGLALKAKEYERAESLAGQAGVSASNIIALTEAKERETRAKEAQEDAKANALDAMAKFERLMAEATAAGSAELASDFHNQAQAVLDQAKQAMLEERFGEALSLAREGASQSAAALAVAQAKAERKRKIEAIENGIMEEAGKVPETTVRKTNRGIVISTGGDLFAQGSSQIKTDIRDRLKALAGILKKYPEYRVIIEGHTDDVGSEESNLKISSDRAYNFLRYLVEQEGISLDVLSSVGFGKSRPVAPNTSEDGRRQNRRIDIVILTVPVLP